MIKVERISPNLDLGTITDEYSQANGVYFQDEGEQGRGLVVQIEGVYFGGNDYKEDIEVAWYGPGTYVRAWRGDPPDFTTELQADEEPDIEEEDDDE